VFIFLSYGSDIVSFVLKLDPVSLQRCPQCMEFHL